MSAVKLADDIINGYQAAMLDALQHQAPLTLVALCAAAGLGRAVGSRHLMSLRERKLVEVTKPMAAASAQDPKRRRSAFLYTVSQAGRQALACYQRKIDAAGRVQAPTFNPADLPPYEPSKQVYYRNAGNKHIQSRGFPC
jgi:predicted ArsR family transcriptional regulator